MMRIFRQIVLIAILTACLVNCAAGQIVFGTPPAASARFVYQSWSIEDDITGDKLDLTQWYFPVYGFIPIAEHWEIRVSSASAGTNSDSSGTDVSITGLNDTRISVLRSLLDNKFLLGAGLNLPTGKATLEPDQSGLSQLLTSDFLNVPTKIYGEGFGLYLEAGYSEQVGRFLLGIGAGYLISSSYSPAEDIDDYNPGSRFRVAGNAVYRHGHGMVHSYLRHTAYGTATQDDIEVYKIGGITELFVGTITNYEQFEINAGMRMLFRQADSRLVSGGLAEYDHDNYGDDLRLYTSLGYILQDIGIPFLLVDYKKVNANGFRSSDEEYIGKSNLFGIGAGFEKSVTEQLDLAASIKTYTGSADDGDLSLSGFEFAFSARATF
jgi:hypothetical protein